MGHRENVQHVTELGHVNSQILETEIHIAPDGTVGQHDALGETCCTTGVVDHAQLLGSILMPVDVFLAISIGETVSEEFVETLAGIGKFLATGEMQGEVGQIEDTLQMGHLVGIDGLYHVVAHKQ